MKHIGLVLPSLPGYSETFFHKKINGLINSGFRVSLFVGVDKNKKQISVKCPVYYQISASNKLLILFAIIKIFLFYPFRSFRLLYLEWICHKSCITVCKHLIINSHIIGKSLDWLHFGFATTGIGRENVAQSIGAKSVVSLRGFDIGLYPEQHPGCYNLLWKKVDRVHTISEALYQKALDFGLSSQVKMDKIYPAIDTNYFQNNSIKKLHNPVRILSIGRLTWVKGFDYSLKAMSFLKKRDIQFEYRIIGDGNYHEAIVYAIHQFGLNEEVKLKGQLTQDKVKEHLKWADIYIQPSIQEGFCNAVLEAQAMGLLCVVSDAGGLVENVINEQTGWVVPKRNPETIFNAIINILNKNPDELDHIRSSSISRIKSVFNLSLQQQYWESYYYKG